MKKLIVLLAVLALAMPSMAGVTLTGTATGLTATIGYNYDGTGSRPRAFALRIQASAGTITAVGKIKTADGVSTAASPGYGIFPGTIVIDTAGNVTNYGSPVEPATLPGASGTGIGTNAVVVALGSLYVGDANKPNNVANILTVTGSANATLTITPETTNRGGVVGEDAATIAVTPNPLTINIGQNDCLMNTAPEYAAWTQVGKPSCWCWKRQCHGDINGTKNTYWVQGGDLSIFRSAFNKNDTVLAGVSGGICGDLNHTKNTYRVQGGDLAIFRTYFNKNETINSVCPSTYINFWTN